MISLKSLRAFLVSQPLFLLSALAAVVNATWNSATCRAGHRRLLPTACGVISEPSRGTVVDQLAGGAALKQISADMPDPE